MTSGQYLLAIDQGTSSSRSVVYDHATQLVASAQQEFSQHYPKPGCADAYAAGIQDRIGSTVNNETARIPLFSKIAVRLTGT